MCQSVFASYIEILTVLAPVITNNRYVLSVFTNSKLLLVPVVNLVHFTLL